MGHGQQLLDQLDGHSVGLLDGLVEFSCAWVSGGGGGGRAWSLGLKWMGSWSIGVSWMGSYRVQGQLDMGGGGGERQGEVCVVFQCVFQYIRQLFDVCMRACEDRIG